MERRLLPLVLGCFLGTFLEWYDYALYSYLAASISTAFFPRGDASVALVETFAVFSLSFLVRPLGGVFWGFIGDRFGRRISLSASILLISGATACIGLIPGYQAIGIYAPCLLLFFRLLQGLSAAGEFAGAAIILAETVPARLRGILTAVVPAGEAMGLLAGACLISGFSTLSHGGPLREWMWRAPFLLSVPIGLVAFFLRRRVLDTAPDTTFRHDVTPIRHLLGQHRGALLTGFLAAVLDAVGFYFVLTFLPTFLLASGLITGDSAAKWEILPLVFFVPAVMGAGFLADRLGARKVLALSALCFILFYLPLLWLMPHLPAGGILACELLLAMFMALADGALPFFLTELFPAGVRYSGFAVAFNLANTVFGGTTPLVMTLFMRLKHAYYLSAGWIIGAAGLTLLAVCLKRGKNPPSVSGSFPPVD
ncbi:MFS transporter [Komagataeibacter sp. FNDCF1]|uniref:MFS transporter n=1 Tax=Komagataeibacter sp. FNDCF1 TaxID=2878681 RepID=UPI001E4853C0|nr:MFS transporter [Komagataeibacter sp. FNDCF1]MCE2563255.1 MFS transporter [Komagataeibacter sp. FNDCF1]